MDGSRPVRSYPFGPPDGLQLHPVYAHLRDHEPLARVKMPYGDEAWLVTRYADARMVFADPRFSLSRAPGREHPRTSPEPTIEGLLALDPPEHTRLRRLVATAFTARRVEQLRARTQQIADDLVDAMVKAGPPADLVTDFALPLPLTVTCELLGVPVADRDRFETWAGAIFDAASLSPGKFREHVARLRAYLAGQIRRRRRHPTDTDLLGALVRARDESDRLSEDEILGLAILLLAAGYETTAGQTANFVHLLCGHPGTADRLRDRPELIPAAVEELMRFVPNAAFAGPARYATEDVPLSGGLVRAGEPVLVCQAAANRDGRVFADPDRLDLTRDPNPHLGFGHGVHHCLGAPLARMELQVGLGALLGRLPGLRLAVAATEVTWRTDRFVRGPVALPVVW